jgi:peptidoglycan/xylan/chitin deacetylase (PgdA/CDA1 family)
MYGVLAISAAAAITAGGYYATRPTCQLYGRTFIGQRRESKNLALTFDDGPNDPHTLRLLDVLAKHNVYATFFMIGRYARMRPDVAREVARAGHAVGNHTFTHPNALFVSALEMKTQLEYCRQALADAVGPHSQFFRPPFGVLTHRMLKTARKMGLETVMWTVEGRDWGPASVNNIVEKVCTRVVGGDVILLHDGGHMRLGADRSRTVLATDRLITRCKEDGYKFSSIAEMTTATPPADALDFANR